MQKPTIACLLVLTLLLSCAGAATFSGYLKTKHAIAIAYCKLRANSDTGETREFTTGRGGAYTVDLGNGVWSILADSDQIREWGFSQMDGVTIVITGDMNVVKNLTLFASEPLQMPSLTFSRPDPRIWKHSIKGQGGTIVRIYSSIDMVTWTPYNAVAIGTTGVDLSASADSHIYYSRIFFRASASSE
jgi:hypothetical protein